MWGRALYIRNGGAARCGDANDLPFASDNSLAGGAQGIVQSLFGPNSTESINGASTPDGPRFHFLIDNPADHEKLASQWRCRIDKKVLDAPGVSM
jgi:hypothetical protein